MNPGTRIARNRPILLAVAAAALLVVFVLLLGGPSGVVRIVRLRQEVHALEDRLHRSTATVDSLKVEIQRLRSDTAYIEKIARERLGMARPDEKIYRFSNGK